MEEHDHPEYQRQIDALNGGKHEATAGAIARLDERTQNIATGVSALLKLTVAIVTVLVASMGILITINWHGGGP